MSIASNATPARPESTGLLSRLLSRWRSLGARFRSTPAGRTIELPTGPDSSAVYAGDNVPHFADLAAALGPGAAPRPAASPAATPPAPPADAEPLARVAERIVREHPDDPAAARAALARRLASRMPGADADTIGALAAEHLASARGGGRPAPAAPQTDAASLIILDDLAPQEPAAAAGRDVPAAAAGPQSGPEWARRENEAVFGLPPGRPRADAGGDAAPAPEPPPAPAPPAASGAYGRGADSAAFDNARAENVAALGPPRKPASTVIERRPLPSVFEMATAASRSRVPEPATPEGEAMVLDAARRRLGDTGLVALLRGELAAVERLLAATPRPDDVAWSGHVRGLVHRRAALRADVTWAESPEPRPAYSVPDAAEVEAEADRLIVEKHLDRGGPAAFGLMLSGLEARALAEGRRALEIDQAMAGQADQVVARRGFLRNAVADRAAALRLHQSLGAAAAALPAALAAAGTAALDASGGAEAVARDVADASALQEPPPAALGGLQGELASIDGQLSALGTSAGRAREELTRRRDELSARADAVRAARAADLADRAAALVGRVASGGASALRELAALVEARPTAFAPGLASALDAVPGRAIEAAGAWSALAALVP